MRVPHSIVGAAAFSLIAAAALAQPPGPHVRVRQVCAADVQKLCPTATPGKGGGMGKCLRENFAQLTDPCRTAIQERMAAHNQPQSPAPPTS